MIASDVALDEGSVGAADPGAGPVGTDRRRQPDAGHRAPHRGLQFAVLALPMALLAVLGWANRSMFYDGYIYLHVVQNILAGHGPVFNAGQRVEAFTSPLWTALLSLASFVTPFSLTTLAVDLGLLLTVGGLALAVASTVRLVRRASPDAFLLPLGAFVFAAVPGGNGAEHSAS